MLAERWGGPNLPQETHPRRLQNVVCVYLFVNTYTQNTATCTKEKLCGTPSLAKKRTNTKKKKHPIKVSFISIHFFFLWIYGISDTVIMGFVHLIYNTTTQSNAVLKERKKKTKFLLDSTLLQQLWLQSFLTRAG